VIDRSNVRHKKSFIYNLFEKNSSPILTTMKTVIAPVDFSEASRNAVLFSAELAKRASAPLVVINILQKGEDEEEPKKKLKDIELDLKKSFGPDLKCETSIARGELVASLQKIIDLHKPDIIVMGTKGASGLKRILIGSNTVNVIAKTTVPVLVIPEAARFEKFLMKGKNGIVLATDLDAVENDGALDLLKEIALLIIEPKIKVLSVRPRNTDIDYLKRMERSALLSVFRPEIESERKTVFSSNVIKGINFYLNTHVDTGLVAMIARDTGNLIQKHYTREMASHTHLPLLVLHDAKM
jgi:nucleotide-binding universal stress UspA family protein